MIGGTVKLVNRERIDKEQIGVKEPFPVTKILRNLHQLFVLCRAVVRFSNPGVLAVMW
mgnify:CR=1 FL=1